MMLSEVRVWIAAGQDTSPPEDQNKEKKEKKEEQFTSNGNANQKETFKTRIIPKSNPNKRRLVGHGDAEDDKQAQEKETAASGGEKKKKKKAKKGLLSFDEAEGDA